MLTTTEFHGFVSPAEKHEGAPQLSHVTITSTGGCVQLFILSNFITNISA
jgi:hypothetical protein